VKDLAQTTLLRLKQMEEVKQDETGERDELVARYVNPRRELIKDSQRYDKKGERRGKKAYSGIANSALGIWSDGMQGHMISKTLRWFKSQLDNPRLNKVDEVQAYCQDYDEAMYAEFDRSNLYSVSPEWFRDAGSIGTAPMYAEEDIGNDAVVYTPLHLREIFISEDPYGNVDTVFRKFFLTAKQAVAKFNKPGDVLSQTIKDNAEKFPEKRHEFVHAVFPNTDRMFDSLLSENKPIASLYLEVSGQENRKAEVVRKSGYDINPYTIWRFRKNSDEIYGYSPAHDMMTTILGDNQLHKTLLNAAHMAVEGVWNIPEHMRGSVRIEPKGYNYFDDYRNQISQANQNINYPIGIDREERMQRLIEDAYRVDFFMMLQRAEREMTATEIMERASEKVVLIGPQVDRLESEGLSNIFDIQSELADRAGRLPEPPQILVDAIGESKYRGQRAPKIGIRFTGPLAIAREMAFRMKPIKNALNDLAQASVLFPNVLKKVRDLEMAEEILDSNNFPARLIKSDEEVEEEMAREAQQMAEQQQLQMAQGAAEAYPKLTKAPEDGSPADMMGQAIGA